MLRNDEELETGGVERRARREQRARREPSDVVESDEIKCSARADEVTMGL
jgi:hypothetical protein